MTEAKKRSLLPYFILVPVAVFALALLFIWISNLRRGPQMMPMPQVVTLGTVESRDIVASMENVALLEADESVDLLARVSGFLVAKNFQDGAMVKKDDVLFQIEPDQYLAALASAEAEVLSAEAAFVKAGLDFNRISDLYRKKTSPKSDYDSSKATYDMARATVINAKARRDQSKLSLDYASIKAPFDGQVGDTPYSVGSVLGPESGVLATVVSRDPMLATFGISDKVLSNFRTNNGVSAGSKDEWQVRVRLADNTMFNEIGELYYMAPFVDKNTDTIKFKARFKNPNNVLAPGQIVVAVLERKKAVKSLLVPKAAVMTDTNGRYVYVPKDMPAQGEGQPPMTVADMRRITIADELEKEYVLADGLKEGEKFIILGLLSQGATLAPGAPIQVAASEPGQPGPGDAPAKGQTGSGNENLPDESGKGGEEK